jgi:2-dehydro-3-deoxyphosphogluconate aldolase/(4S)-4-hydroxy-2-oxoglutarate aldolase
VTLSRVRTLSRIADGGVVAVMRDVPPDAAVETADALRSGGVPAVEVTIDRPGALAVLAEVRAAFDPDELLVGAGTVLEASTAARAATAGADFVLSPHLDAGVVETCRRHGLVVAPGATTPTEAVRAVETGADAVKLFPASTLGPDHLRAIRGPLSQVPLLPTGGVTVENAGAFVRAGAAAVAAGSALVDPGRIERGEFDAIATRGRAFVDAVAAARE